MNLTGLRDEVELLFAEAATLSKGGASPADGDAFRAKVIPVVKRLQEALESGVARAAHPVGDDWEVNVWVKKGILLGFQVGRDRSWASTPPFGFRDRDTYGTWDPEIADRRVRIVPGGTTVRSGAYIGDQVVIMPPAYVNVGAFVGTGSMVDSHALVGSCAQIGQGVHLSAAVQVGGVLEPIGATPVIVEDEAFIGGGCGIYEGTQVGARAVLGAGVILTRGVAVHDLVRETVHRAAAGSALKIPAGAVVVPGTRKAVGRYAESHGLNLQTPIIVKYRDDRTDAGLALEEALR